MSAPGIYRIRNENDGKTYVGQSNDVHLRLEGHRQKLFSGKHRNSNLQRAWNEEGSEAFSFDVVEILDAPSKEELNAAEHRTWLEVPAALRYNANEPPT